jgi:hypothetical protein
MGALTTLGYTVKLMAPQFVKPSVKTNKNDAADAEAVCEAVSRPNMRFVANQDTGSAGSTGPASCQARLCSTVHGTGNQIRGNAADKCEFLKGNFDHFKVDLKKTVSSQADPSDRESATKQIKFVLQLDIGLKSCRGSRLHTSLYLNCY